MNKINCIQDTVSPINGKLFFLKGNQYNAKINEEDDRFLMAQNEEGTWINISFRPDSNHSFENEMFLTQFSFA